MKWPIASQQNAPHFPLQIVLQAKSTNPQLRKNVETQSHLWKAKPMKCLKKKLSFELRPMGRDYSPRWSDELEV